MTTLAQDLYLLVAAYGLAVAVTYAGLPVLGQSAFVAVGAFGTTQLVMHGTPLGVAVVVAVAAAALAGYAIGFAAARLDGGPLALATWALAWLAYTALVVFPRLGGGAQGLTRPSPARLVSPTLGLTAVLSPWVHVVVATAVAAVVAVVLWRSDRLAWGLDLAALRSGPVLAESLGVPVRRRRCAILAVAAALGALGGAGTAVLLGVVAPADYSPLLSLQLFVAVLVGGAATWWGPALGVAALAALPTVADHFATAVDVDPERARAVVTASLLVLVVATRGPMSRLIARRRGPQRLPRADAAAPSAADLRPGVAPTVRLELRGVVASYGAVRALDGVDLTVRAGEVHALVGPNGSGKSTALRVAAGAVRPQSGAVHVEGEVASPLDGASARVRRGVARTLQQTVMLGDLTARTQVAVAARAGDRLAHLGLREVLATPAARLARARRDSATTAALARVGLGDRADLPAQRLDTADQRLLQVARIAATGAGVLLLDEPAAGMSAAQRQRLAAVLRDLAAGGCAVLLVEHDMALVGRVADRVTVLDAGRVLVTAAPDVVRRNADVARAYLGPDMNAEPAT